MNSSNPALPTRRRLACALALVTTVGCGSRPPPKPPLQLTDAQRARIERFRGVRGYELVQDAMEHLKATFHDDQGYSMGTGNFRARADRKESRSFGLKGPLEYVDVAVYEPDAVGDWSHPDSQLRYKGTLLGKYRVPIADRIPDALLEDLRRERGGLRIKLRLHREGVLFGWDIERRPGYDPRKRDQFGSAVYVAPVHSFAGGDFREARIINGKAVRKGWYIHPRTGERFETDF